MQFLLTLSRNAPGWALRLPSAAQHSWLRHLSTPAAPRTSKSILHSLAADKANNQSWLEQKLTKEQQAANKKHRKQSHVSQLDRRSPRSLSSSAGFVKIEHDRRPAKEHTRAKGLESGEDGDETAEVTLTAKALAAKTKWQQSGAAKSQMQSKLRDPSLAGWQRRKIELKLKHGDDQWDPAKKIATSSMEKIRLLNAEFPEVWTMQRLSEQFKVSQETVRRILKSRFRPSAEHTEKREQKRKAEMQAYREKTKPHHERTDGRQPDVYDAVN